MAIKEINLWKFILERLEKSQTVIFMCVVESLGSSPGRGGFKMAIASDGITGSIGGGVMEHKFVELAREKLNLNRVDPLIKKQIHSKVAKKDQSGMICSGEQTIVLFQLGYNDRVVVEQIVFTLSENRSGLLRVSPDHLSLSEDIGNKQDYFFEMKSEEEWIYEEIIGYRNNIYIVGGGHCSLALASILQSLDFYVHVFDDRKDLNTLSANKFAHEVKCVDDYSSMKEFIPSGKNNYVVIMTFGYRTDDIALRSVIHNEYKYLGVLGSQSKIEKMLVEWRSDGLPEEKLKQIHAPVGLKINSHTPEEIAVSIAAEIIAVKNAC